MLSVFFPSGAVIAAFRRVYKSTPLQTPPVGGGLSRRNRIVSRNTDGNYAKTHPEPATGRRDANIYLTMVSPRSGPTEMIFTGTPVWCSMNST